MNVTVRRIGRPKLIREEHSNPFVRDLLAKAEVKNMKHSILGELAGLAQNYITTIRRRKNVDPGIMRMQKLYDVLGYEIVVVKKRDVNRRYGK